MACNACGGRAARLLRSLGFRDQERSTGVDLVLDTPRGRLVLPGKQLQQHHFVLTLLAVVALLVLGGPVKEASDGSEARHLPA